MHFTTLSLVLLSLLPSTLADDTTCNSLDAEGATLSEVIDVLSEACNNAVWPELSAGSSGNAYRKCKFLDSPNLTLNLEAKNDGTDDWPGFHKGSDTCVDKLTIAANGCVDGRKTVGGFVDFNGDGTSIGFSIIYENLPSDCQANNS